MSTLGDRVMELVVESLGAHPLPEVDTVWKVADISFRAGGETISQFASDGELETFHTIEMDVRLAAIRKVPR